MRRWLNCVHLVICLRAMWALPASSSWNRSPLFTFETYLHLLYRASFRSILCELNSQNKYWSMICSQIRLCRLPASLIGKLGLKSVRRRRKYDAVPMEYGGRRGGMQDTIIDWLIITKSHARQVIISDGGRRKGLMRLNYKRTRLRLLIVLIHFKINALAFTWIHSALWFGQDSLHYLNKNYLRIQRIDSFVIILP